VVKYYPIEILKVYASGLRLELTVKFMMEGQLAEQQETIIFGYPR
jgi:hypothetical protein